MSEAGQGGASISDAVLQAEGLTYCYHGRPAPAVRDVSLVARAGDCLLVTGPSGCGKSTLARCLTGLIPHLYKGTLDGQVWIGGVRSDETPLWHLAETAGMVLQNPEAQMLASTVEDEIIFGLENLGLTRDTIAGRLEESLDRFGLQRLRRRDPRRLSGGEGQRVMLAAMLSRQAPALVLDEPLSMLDTAMAGELVSYLTDLARRGSAVVVCEHRAHYFSGSDPYREHRLCGAEPISSDDAGSDAPLSDVPPFDLCARGLTVARGGRVVLAGIDLELAGGQVTALVGVNGSGKTTLLRALVGLQRHEGSVVVTTGDEPDLGMVFQNPDLQLFNPTVREEMRYRMDAPDETLYGWLLSRLGLVRYEGASPLLLSEGEKKRLCLALVLQRRPQHGVLLDEPTLGQDDAHRATLGRMARSLAGSGRLVLTATHDLSWAAHYADRMLVLHDGRIVASGEPAALLRDAALWALVGLRVPAWVWEPSA
jgi:energy-coupling factor transport system ATP-binding protein